MAHYQVILAYDGSAFLGFQRQKKGRTVQAEVETALRKLNWDGDSILAAGRTDSGVHASGQVVTFDLDWQHTPGALGRAMNSHLPVDVAVQHVEEAEPGFHPRYDALSRSYQYRLYCQSNRNPLFERIAWRVFPTVNFERLEDAAAMLIGKHDFAAFGSAPEEKGSTVRTVFEAVWQQETQQITFSVTADAFLYHMVRRLVFLQVLVAQGKLALQELLDGVRFTKPLPPGLAPPQGLTLTKVKYAPPISGKNG